MGVFPSLQKSKIAHKYDLTKARTFLENALFLDKEHNSLTNSLTQRK